MASNIPLAVEFSAAYLDGVMESEHPEVRQQWKSIRDYLRDHAPAAGLPCPAAGDPRALPARDLSKPARAQGLFEKFAVRRLDGSDQPGGKHAGCRNFVLDVDHDQYAGVALTAYAMACEADYPELACALRETWGAGPAQTGGLAQTGNVVLNMRVLEHAPNLERLADRLLAPREIVRDEFGHLSHPAMPLLDESVRYDQFLAAFGIEATYLSMENDVSRETMARYNDSNDPDCSDWTPTTPDGDGWMLLEIYDTEDGPHAVFGRLLKENRR